METRKGNDAISLTSAPFFLSDNQRGFDKSIISWPLKDEDGSGPGATKQVDAK